MRFVLLEAYANDTRAFISTGFAHVGCKESNKARLEDCENLAATQKITGTVNLLSIRECLI